MPSTRNDVIQDALLRAEEIQNRTIDLAKSQLYEIFANNVHDSLSKALNEAVTVGKDQPSGYDQDADQDALAYGSVKHKGAGKEDINKGGKGPQKLEGSINFDETEDMEVDETEDFEVDENDELEAIPINEEEDYDELDETSDNEESVDEAVDETETVDETEEVVDENVADETKLNELKNTVKKLTKELSEYKKAFNILKDKFNEVNLLNVKVTESVKYLKRPGLTLKQKEAIVEAFDRAKTIREVKLVSKTLSEGMKTVVRSQKTVLNNVVKPASSKRFDEAYSVEAKRLQELSGIL